VQETEGLGEHWSERAGDNVAKLRQLVFVAGRASTGGLGGHCRRADVRSISYRQNCDSSAPPSYRLFVAPRGNRREKAKMMASRCLGLAAVRLCPKR